MHDLQDRQSNGIGTPPILCSSLPAPTVIYETGAFLGFYSFPAGKSSVRFVGHRPGSEVPWQVNRHLWFQADYGMFYAGKFVKESQPAAPELLGSMDWIQVVRANNITQQLWLSIFVMSFGKARPSKRPTRCQQAVSWF